MDVKEKTKQGRKTSSAYDLYGFIPQFNCGKHSALCKSCNRVLQNTASARLLKHRNSCSAVIGNRNLPQDSPKEAKRRRAPECRNKPAKIPHREPEEENPQQQIENYMTHNEMEITQVENSSVRDFIKVELNTCVANNPYVEDSVADYSPQRKFKAKQAYRNDDKIKAKIQYFKEKSKYFHSELNNLKVEKTLIVLEVKKLRWEIKQLE